MKDAPLLGFTVAAIAAIPFAAYIFPRKLSRLPVLEYQCWLSLAVAPIGVLFAYLFGGGLDISHPMVGFAFICGPIWTLGSICYSKAVDHIGVARSTPVKNLAPMFAAIYGIAIFGEYTINDPISLAMTIGGVGFMISAASVLGKAGANENERALAYDHRLSDMQRKALMTKGWIYSALTAFFYGLYAIPVKHALRNDMEAATICAWLGVGVLVSSSFALLMVKKRIWPAWPGWREFRLGQIAGGIWITAQTLGTVAMQYVPMAISWPVTNLSTLIAIAWGVWVFHEVRIERHLREVVGAIFLYSIGLVLLALAAPKGQV